MRVSDVSAAFMKKSSVLKPKLIRVSSTEDPLLTVISIALALKYFGSSLTETSDLTRYVEKAKRGNY